VVLRESRNLFQQTGICWDTVLSLSMDCCNPESREGVATEARRSRISFAMQQLIESSATSLDKPAFNCAIETPPLFGLRGIPGGAARMTIMKNECEKRRKKRGGLPK